MARACPWCAEPLSRRERRGEACPHCGRPLVGDEGDELRPIDLRYERVRSVQQARFARLVALGSLVAAGVGLVLTPLHLAATAAGVHFLRNQVRRPFREVAEALHEGASKAASLSEAGVSAAVAGSAVLAPVASIVLLGGVGAAALLVGRAVDRRRKPCVYCGQPIRPAALVCPHCGRDQA